MLKATPQRFGPWLVAAAAPHKPAELRKPAYGLAQRGWLVRWGRTVMDGTIQRLPFLDRQQDVTWHLGYRSCQHEGIKHPPGNDAVERQTALQALVGGQLARFEATATFQNPVPDLNPPATRVPLGAFVGVLDAVHSDRGQQQPRDGRPLRWGLYFSDLDGPQRHRGQTLRLAMPGRTQRQATKPQRQYGFTSGLRAPPRHLQAELLHHGLRFHGGPYIALWRAHTAVPRRPNQQLDACRPRGHQQVIDIGFPVANAHKAGLRTRLASAAHGVKTREPFLAFLLADGQPLAPGPLANVVRITRPDLLGHQPQGHPFGAERQRAMDQQPLTGRMPQGPQALGGGVRRSVAFGGILDRQDPGYLGQAAVSRLDMAEQDVLRLDGVVIKEAIRGFEHGVVATGFG